jgi:D-hexose-6-phosphate mutarotase
MGYIPQNFKKTVIQIAKIFNNYQYAIRGTASLVLQNFDMNVEDIDIISDKDTSIKCNTIFKKYLKEKIEYKISDKFKSYFGKAKINNINIEIMGCFQIKNKKGKWSKIFSAGNNEITTIKLNNNNVNVTKAEIELEMFALMGRWNAYHKLKEQVDKTKQLIFSL